MTSSVRLSGCTIGTGDNHICALFRQRDEEYSALLPFITEGIEYGERALHIVDPDLRADHLNRLKQAGIAVAVVEERQQLEVRDWHETYLRGGTFSPSAMISLAEQLLEGGRVGDFTRSRLIGHMEWALGNASWLEDLLEYEARLNYVLPRYQDPVICVYDTTRFGAGTLLDILRTHPMVILDGVLQVNPYFIPPGEFLRELRQSGHRVPRLKGRLKPPSLPIVPGSPPQHSEIVMAVIGDEASSVGIEVVSDSWRRSVQLHRIDPDSREPPRILTASALRGSREPIEPVLDAAQPPLDWLHRIVSQAGYVTLLCDTQGVAVDHRGNEERSAECRNWGIWLGGVWSEAVEGTNGIGTCIADGRPVTVHQTQHFRSRHISLSCSGAPVFDADARLVAVLDVSSMDPHVSGQAHALTLPLVVNFARLIEERLFRERFARAWIIAIAPHADQPGALLAVDREHCVIGADRCARRQFNLDQCALETGTSVWTIFSRSGAVLQRGSRADYPVRLTPVRGGDTMFALVSTPTAASRVHFGKHDRTLLMQPRIPFLEQLQRQFAPDAPRGGLSPGALRRAKEYIAAHIDEDVEIGTLALNAGLSAYHFARAFKSSVGMPPHRYLLEQRVRKAAELLQRTEQSLASIALAGGFADQSHFSRSFHALVGVTPSQFRRAHR